MKTRQYSLQRKFIRICFIRLQHLVTEYNPCSDLHITEPLCVLGTFSQLLTDNHKVAVHFRILYCYFRTSQFHCRKFCIIVILPGVQKFPVTLVSRPRVEKLEVLGGQHEDKRSPGSHKHRWNNN
jgi:hypothetical protein